MSDPDVIRLGQSAASRRASWPSRDAGQYTDVAKAAVRKEVGLKETIRRAKEKKREIEQIPVMMK